ncbi:MAG: protein kinase [Ancalomicrobiaceae bacterium]|nr:protein kinase [Ancalomicrobiaceae bacterium]
MDTRDNILLLKRGEKVRNFTLLDRSERSADLVADGEIIAPLGSGGSASVYIAKQELFNLSNIRRVIKFFVFREDVSKLRGLEETPISDESFLAEISVLSNLNHRNLIKIFDAGLHPHGGRMIPFIVYDFIDGPTLKDYSVRLSEKSFNIDEFLKKIIDMCEGVQYLHDSGYYHYDIAPKNIFCNSQNSDTFIVGDLGLASRFDSRPQEIKEILVIGSRDWMPPNAACYLDQRIDRKLYENLQPEWDTYGLAATIKDLFERNGGPKEIRWVQDLVRELSLICSSPRSYSVEALIKRIKFTAPSTRQVFGVPELSPGMTDKQITLMPVHALITTRRVEDLINHPEIQRLSRVPQLTAAYRHFPSANHTRLEHSLGVMEVMRRYLVSIINEKYALSHLSQQHIETALIAALLSNLHQFSFTNVINEINLAGSWEKHLNKRLLLKRIIERNVNGHMSLKELIVDLFPNADIKMLYRILTGGTHDDGERLIYSMLNSSIDARVVDYISRDSYHLGIGGYRFPDDEIFQFLTLDDGRIALNIRGVSAAEQIIAQRYWLFNRFYWNRPNRRYVSLLRTVLLKLGENEVFVENLFDRYADLDQEEALRDLENEVAKCGDSRVASLAPFIRGSKDRQYKIRYDSNILEKARLGVIFDHVDAMSNEERIDLEHRLGDELFGQNQNVYSVMIDLPKERGAKKSGDDVTVALKKDVKSDLTLLKVSSIVKGIRESYDEQLRHLRVFVHPDIEVSSEKKLLLDEQIDRFLSRL